jgi:predicted dehydrogenase
VEIVEIARRAGVKLAVNQQMRWDPAIRASKRLIEKGWLGELTAATINVNILTEWEMWPWLSAQETLDFMYHSIHYFDSIRFLLGEPHRLVATTARFPGQIPKGETRSFTVFDYGDTCKAFVLVNHNNWSDRRYALVRVEGTEGVAEGTLGLLYNYPFGQPDTLEFTSKHHYPQYTFAHRFQDRWVPDAFLGPMADLQCAIEEGREPETAGADNLNTLRIVQAAYRSAAEGRSVDPREIQATLAHA